MSKKKKKKIKGLLFHCREISDHKYWWSSKALSVLSKSILKPGRFFIKFLTKLVGKLEKLKSQNFNFTVAQLCNSLKPNVWYFRNLEKLAIKIRFPFNSAKNVKDRHFVVGGSKNLKLLPNTCFDVSFQEKCIAEFSDSFVCLLLRWSKE